MANLSIEPSQLPAPEPHSRAPAPSANQVVPWRPSPFSSTAATTLDVSALQVELVTSVEVLAELEPQWQALADEAVEPNPFYEPWMVLPALRTLSGAKPLFVLVWAPHPSGRKGERLLCGLLPLLDEPMIGRAGAHGPRLLTLWKYRYCYLTLPLLRRGVPREALGAFFRWLEQSGRVRNSLLKFPEAPAEGVVAQAWVDVSRQLGWPSWRSESFTRAMFRPAPTAERFIETAVTGKRRKEWRRLASRLEEHGPVEVEELESTEALRAWTQAFVELEASGWKGREGVAVASDQGDRQFFEELCRHAQLRDRLQLLALKVGGRPIAMKLNLFSGDGAGFAFKIAFDEGFARYSPGVLLELENIQRLHLRPGLSWMDSCAAPNRFMINQLWPERRQIQTLFLAAPGTTTELALSLLPLVRWGKAQLRRLRKALHRAPQGKEVPGVAK